MRENAASRLWDPTQTQLDSTCDSHDTSEFPDEKTLVWCGGQSSRAASASAWCLRRVQPLQLAWRPQTSGSDFVCPNVIASPFPTAGDLFLHFAKCRKFQTSYNSVLLVTFCLVFFSLMKYLLPHNCITQCVFGLIGQISSTCSGQDVPSLDI